MAPTNLQRLERWVRDHPGEKVTSNHVARELNLTRWYVGNTFRWINNVKKVTETDPVIWEILPQGAV